MNDQRFEPGSRNLKLTIRRALHRLVDAQPLPPHAVVRPAVPARRWTLYFCYAPDGQPSLNHQATLATLRAANHHILVVLATEEGANIAPFFAQAADAVIWKALAGYDFSGYAIGLRHLVAMSPGCDVIVMNDSVIGPLCDLNAVFDAKPWDFVGLTSCDTRERHIQSYAFMIRKLTPQRLDALKSVLSDRIAYSDYMAVVRNQESQLARVASRSMSVGVLWPSQEDAPLFAPLALLDAGFPFIKASHFGKFDGYTSDADKAALIARRDAYLSRVGLAPETGGVATVASLIAANPAAIRA